MPCVRCWALNTHTNTWECGNWKRGHPKLHKVLAAEHKLVFLHFDLRLQSRTCKQIKSRTRMSLFLKVNPKESFYVLSFCCLSFRGDSSFKQEVKPLQWFEETQWDKAQTRKRRKLMVRLSYNLSVIRHHPVRRFLLPRCIRTVSPGSLKCRSRLQWVQPTSCFLLSISTTQSVYGTERRASAYFTCSQQIPYSEKWTAHAAL